MKEKYDKLTHHRWVHLLCMLVCAASAAYLMYSAVMLFLVYKGGYHDLGTEGTLARAEQLADEYRMADLLEELSLSPVTEYDHETGKETELTYEQVQEKWIKAAEAFAEQEKAVDFAVVVADREDGFLTQPNYLYRTEGFTTYTEYLQVQAFRQYYTGSRDPYSGLVTPLWMNSYGRWPAEELPFGQAHFLTILFQHKDGVSGLEDKQIEFVLAMNQADMNTGLLVIPMILCILSFVQCCCSAGYRNGENEVHPGFLDRIPMLFWLAPIILAVLTPAFLSEFYLSDDAMAWFTFPEYTLIFMAVVFVLGLLGLAFLSTFIVRIKSKTVWKTTLVYYILRWMKNRLLPIGNWAYEHLPLAVRLGIAVPVIAVISIIEAALIQDCGMEFAALFLIGRIGCLALLVYLFWGYGKLRDGAARIAAGDLEHPVNEKFLAPDFRFFAKNLNSVGESIQVAVEERMKSERLKTQLITNVSHDIKTPLTSIINYVDLLSQSDATEEEKTEYLGILAHQSDRLKKLIQDLIDASKASSGAVEVDLSEVNLNTLVGQVSGEFQDKLDAARLMLILKEKKNDIMVSADSNLLWRVLDNLFVNTLKYAMPGTRVYMEVAEEGDMATFSLSNISKAELGVSGNELMERFVRGDASRNTEGSGLGLSIAKSLMELMGGDLHITVDGDMFKAVLQLKVTE